MVVPDYEQCLKCEFDPQWSFRKILTMRGCQGYRGPCDLDPNGLCDNCPNALFHCHNRAVFIAGNSGSAIKGSDLDHDQSMLSYSLFFGSHLYLVDGLRSSQTSVKNDPVSVKSASVMCRWMNEGGLPCEEPEPG